MAIKLGYNGKTHRIYDISQYRMNTQDMLSYFWFDLLSQNKGRSIYFIIGLAMSLSFL